MGDLLYISNTVNNSTGCTMDGLSTSTKDGGFSTSPSSSIPNGGSTTFKVEQSNHMSSGPEGTATWNVETGNESIAATVYWMLSSGAQHDHTHSWTIYDSRLTGTSSSSAASGDSENFSYVLTYTPRSPNDWDMVWSLSVGLMNSQLQYLWGEGVLPRALSGTSGSSTLTVSSLNAPSVAVPDTSTTHIELHLPFGSASLVYQDGSTQTLSLSGDTVIVTMSLSNASVTDPSTLQGSQEARDTLAGLSGPNFGIYRVFLDLTSPSLFVSLRVVTSSGAAVSLSSAATAALKATLGAVGQVDLAYPVVAKGTPATLVPTRVSAGTTEYTSNGMASTLNVCMMTRGRNDPALASRYTFPAPMASVPASTGSASQNLARLYISQDTLGRCYVEPVLVPFIAAATAVTDESGTELAPAVTMSSQWLAPLTYLVSGARNNHAKNGGRGEHIGVNNGLDQYLYGTETWVYTLTPVTSAVGTCTFTLSGTLSLDSDIYQYPLGGAVGEKGSKLGTATYSQNWTGTVTLTAGTHGKMVTTVAISLSGDPSKDVDHNLRGLVWDGVDSVLGWTTDGPSAAITDKMGSFGAKLTSSFAANASAQVDASQALVLPTGALEAYAAFGFNADGAIQVDVSFPTPNI